MSAEPVALRPVPEPEGNFLSDATDAVVLGPCWCPGRPHEEDVAEVRRVLDWGTLVDAGAAATAAAAYRELVFGALVGWNLLDAAGAPVPVTREAIARLRPERLEAIATLVNAAHERARAPLPNASPARSPRSARASGSQDPTIRPRARRGKSR